MSTSSLNSSSNRESLLQSMNKYGGKETAEEMARVNEQLREFGILEQLEDEEEGYVAQPSSLNPGKLWFSKDPIRMQADAKKVRARERMIDKALERLAESQFPPVTLDGYSYGDNTGGTDVFSKPLQKEDIERVLFEAKADIDAECIPIATSEQMEFLLSTVKSHLNRKSPTGKAMKDLTGEINLLKPVRVVC